MARRRVSPMLAGKNAPAVKIRAVVLPAERIPQKRRGLRHWRKPEPVACAFLAPCFHLRGRVPVGQPCRKFPELSHDRAKWRGDDPRCQPESGGCCQRGLPVAWREALVIASGFPIPSAPTVLVRLALAGVRPRGRFPAAGAAMSPRRCTANSRGWLPRRPRGAVGLSRLRVSAPA